MSTTFQGVIGAGLPCELAKQMDTALDATFTTNLAMGVQSNAAAVGCSIGSATALTADLVLIGSCSKDSNDAFSLRSYSSGNRVQIVINRSGSQAQIFPPLGGFIGVSATNAAYSLANLQAAEFCAVGAKEYWVLPKGA